MTNSAIEVTELFKRFRINHAEAHKNGRYRTLRESLNGMVATAWKNLRSGAALGNVEEFWALRNISFQIAAGDVVGIIGRNGAGKSTLLKILTRITEPTSGQALIRGRVGSLLEVGTGFHPELTGRENVYLNGSILGMTRREIKRNFDLIVDFSGVERFLDTPVKRYSSGMKVRLAFSIAAHLELEVMLVDEVLAVGDVDFQRKCLGRMSEVSKSGRTVLFVSHNMGAIGQLCPKSIWLKDGQVHDIGPSRNVIGEYLKDADAAKGQSHAEFPADPSKDAQLRAVRLLDESGHATQTFDCDKRIVLEMDFQVHRPVRGLYGYLSISGTDGTTVMMSDSFDAPPNPFDGLDVGHHTFRIVIPARTLAPGQFSVYLSFASRQAEPPLVDVPGNVCQFTLEDYTSRRGNARLGYFSTLLDWSRSDGKGD